jgi:hypothetical protein
MSQLTNSSGSQYTDQDRQRVIAEYAVSGNQSRVAESLNLPRQTVAGWINSDWGVELLVKIRHENQNEFISGYTKIVQANLAAQSDRIEHGDVVGLDDDGKPLRQPIKYRDLVVGAGIAVDKIRLLSNQATSITVTDNALTKISAQLAAFAVDKQDQCHVIEHDSSASD